MADFPPPSLARLFDPPEGMYGDFGWVCGYSADARFMESAVERFSCRTRSQRIQEGRIFLALLLDPGNPQIPLHACPGIRHLGMKNRASADKFKLMHAKVALLLFRNERGDAHTLRLIVSTGNWTDQTVRESLDLFWYVDVDVQSKDISSRAQECADFQAAREFLRYLRKMYEPVLPDGVMQGQDYSATAEAHDRFEKNLAVIRPRTACAPRFMDNREKPFLQQIRQRIAAMDGENGGVRRNYLAMGSGFFEGGSNGKLPSVPVDIVKELKMAKLLTQSSEVDIFVDPVACQGMATAGDAITQEGWAIRAAAPPLALFRHDGPRTLHAKFLFSANCRQDSDRCNNPWVYLGSGNLTQQGFTNKLPHGNLEAGVLFKPETLFWNPQPGQPSTWISNLLPVSWDADPIQPQALQSGSSMEERPSELFFAAPVSLLLWCKGDNGAVLEAPALPEPLETYEVFSIEGHACPPLKPGIFAWKGDKPREVEVRWQGTRAKVPVMDEYGRIGASDLRPARSLAEAWTLLAEFSAYPEIDEEASDAPADVEGKGTESDGTTKHSSARSAAASGSLYPVRSMMELLERIAEKQAGLREPDWLLWCIRLKMTFEQAAACPEADFFRTWKINPLTPLRQLCFVPTFAEKGEKHELYLAVLDDAALAWKVDGEDFIGLGVCDNAKESEQ
jgi:hypothetical protein